MSCAFIILALSYPHGGFEGKFGLQQLFFLSCFIFAIHISFANGRWYINLSKQM